MRRFSGLLACAAILASSALANPPNLKGILGMEAGDYSFTQYNRGELQKFYLDQYFQRNKEDRDYFLGAVRDIENEFMRFVKSSMYGEGGLKRMSDRSTKGKGQPVTADEFLSAINDFNLGRLALETKINSLTSLAGALPSQFNPTVKGSGTGSIPGYGNIDFSKITGFYNARLAEIATFVSNLPHSIKLPSGIMHLITDNSGKGLELDVPTFQFTAEQIIGMRKQALEYRMWSAKAEEEINSYTVYVKRLVQKFIKTYGTTERWRFHDAADDRAKKEAAAEIAQAFWSRSYLRAVYGMPLGGIGIRYQKKVANLDFFTASTKGLAQFLEEPVWEQTEMMEIEQNYRLALNVADARSSKILDGSVSLLRRANSLITFLGGYGELADALKTVLQLMAADFYEEKLIIQAGGLRKMAGHYRTRYYISDEDKKFHRGLEAAYDPETAGKDDSDPYGDVGAVSAGSLRKYFETVLIHTKTKEYEIGLAEDLESKIVNATKLADKASGKRKERRKRLDE